MKTIKIKGEQKGFVVDDATGSRIVELKTSGSNDWVNLNGVSVNISDVRLVLDGLDEDNRAKFKDKENEDRREENNGDYKMAQQEFRNLVMAQLKMSQVEKVKYNLIIAGCYCRAITNLEIKTWADKNLDLGNNLKKIIIDELSLGAELIVSPLKYRNLFMRDDRINKIFSGEYLGRGAMLGVAERIMAATYGEINDIKKYGSRI